ncbi:MAG TPA: hypothetical protein VNB22_13340 [Pyrinomonadaceae bacterium]|nr:hypothetical protein [Pyrinomonadaceae bacterium]
MKRFALTNLMLLIAIKSVSACESLSQAESRIVWEQRYYDNIWFLTLASLIIPIGILYYLRNFKGLWVLVASIILVLVFVPITFAVGLMNSCGTEPVSTLIKGELFLMLLLFTYQLSSWISQRKTSIKLR